METGSHVTASATIHSCFSPLLRRLSRICPPFERAFFREMLSLQVSRGRLQTADFEASVSAAGNSRSWRRKGVVLKIRPEAVDVRFALESGHGGVGLALMRALPACQMISSARTKR